MFGAWVGSYVVMLGGRLIFASGSESLLVVQAQYVEKWFRDQELATALGAAVGIPFVGSYAAAFIVPAMAKEGLPWAYAPGAVVAAISLVCAGAFVVLDVAMEKHDKKYEIMKASNTKFDLGPADGSRPKPSMHAKVSEYG